MHIIHRNELCTWLQWVLSNFMARDRFSRTINIITKSIYYRIFFHMISPFFKDSLVFMNAKDQNLTKNHQNFRHFALVNFLSPPS